MNDDRTLIALSEVVKYEHKEKLVEWAEKVEKLEAELALYKSGAKSTFGYATFVDCREWTKDSLREFIQEEGHVLNDAEWDEFLQNCEIPWLTPEGWKDSAEGAIEDHWRMHMEDGWEGYHKDDCSAALNAIIAARGNGN